MKGKFFRLCIVCIILIGGFWAAGGFSRSARFFIKRYLRNRQGIEATIGEITLTAINAVSIKDVTFCSIYDDKPQLMVSETIDLRFGRDESKGNRIVPVYVSLNRGTIYGRKLGSHFSHRRKVREAQKANAQTSVTAPSDSKNTDSTSTTDSSPTSGESKDPSEKQKMPPPLTRQLVMSDMTLDGGTLSVNLLIARKEVPVRLTSISSSFLVSGSRFVIEELSWKMGPLHPSIQNREFDAALLSDTDRIKGIPKEIAGLLILTDILLGASSQSGGTN